MLTQELVNYETVREEMSEVRRELQSAIQHMRPEMVKLLKPTEVVEVEHDFRQLDELLERLESGFIWISLFGKTSVGKSAIANSLMEAEVAEVGIQIDLTTEVRPYQKDPWMIVDVPGIMGQEVNEQVAIAEAKKAHALIFCVDSEPYGPELKLFELVHQAVPNTPVIVFVNKWDKMQHVPQKDRDTVRNLIEKKMGKFVKSPADIVYGHAQIFDSVTDSMVRQPLPQLLDKLYEDAGTLGQVMNVLDPAHRAADLSSNLRNKIFDLRAKIARKVIRGFGLASIASNIIPMDELILAPGILGSMVFTLFKIMGSKISKESATRVSRDLLKVCAQELGATFVAVAVASVALNIFGPVGLLVDVALLSAFKYQRAVVLGEVVLEYIRTDGKWGAEGQHAAILKCRDRAKTLYGQIKK